MEWKGVQECTFSESMILARNATKEPKLLSTHYKIIHNIWPTKEKFLQWRIENNPDCHCIERDTIIHSLCVCTYTQTFLEDAFQYLDRNNAFQQTLHFENFIFGVKDNAWNMILLVLKWYIVTSRLKTYRLNIEAFRLHLMNRIVAEKHITQNYKFQEKWQGFEWLIEEREAYFNQFI